MAQRLMMPREKHRGPVHEMSTRNLWQTRCGVRPQFRHVVRDAKEGDEVTCPKCIRAEARGRDYSRGA